MPELTKVTIYTDGACSGNPGPGGWGAILSVKGHSREISGGEAHTTNNRMERMAVIKSLELLTRPCEVELYSDSAYVVNAFNQHWIEGWQKKGWVNSAKNPVANRDLWEALLSLCDVHKVTFIKVKGHADNEFNNRCDQLAVAESQKYAKES